MWKSSHPILPFTCAPLVLSAARVSAQTSDEITGLVTDSSVGGSVWLPKKHFGPISHEIGVSMFIVRIGLPSGGNQCLSASITG
jgi:hypothetical protein